METEKKQSYKRLKEKHKVPVAVKENLKEFTRTKKTILKALEEKEMTIEELSEKLGMARHDVVYFLMTLLKYGQVEKGEIDDMDEYFTYKLPDK